MSHPSFFYTVYITVSQSSDGLFRDGPNSTGLYIVLHGWKFTDIDGDKKTFGKNGFDE